MCSSIVKNSAVQIAAFAIGLTIATAVQELSPAFVGVKPPFVAAAVLFMAFRASFYVVLAVAVASGLFMDALSGLPAFCCTSFMPLLSLGMYFMRENLRDISAPVVGAGATAAVSAIGEIWLAICGFSSVDTGLFVRICAAIFIAMPVGAVVFAVMPVLGRHIGLEEPS